MRSLWIIAIVGCATPAVKKPAESVELGAIMKAKMNQPFSALTFLVQDGSELDLGSLQGAVQTLLTGICSIPDLPDQTESARLVFRTYVDTIARQSRQFVRAAAVVDRQGMAQSLEKISRTCNDCHHFFRPELPADPGTIPEIRWPERCAR